MSPLMQYDALMLVGREKAAQALADEVARRVLAQLEPVPVRETGAVVEMDRFTHSHCEAHGFCRHFVLDSGDAVCIRCCGPGEDFGGEEI